MKHLKEGVTDESEEAIVASYARRYEHLDETEEQLLDALAQFSMTACLAT